MSVIVVAAHPDDDVLGCGGAIARHARDGERVEIVYLADGVTARETHGGARDDAALSRRRSAAVRAAGVLGATDVVFGDLPDNRMDTVALLDIVRIVEDHIERVRPTVVYTHSPIDLNIDHRLAHEAVMTACRPQSDHVVRTILSFEVPSSSHWRSPSSAAAFAPNWYVDISEVLDLKIAALSAYEEELRPWPHPRSVEAIAHLAAWHGAGIGVSAAEAFCVERHIR